MKKILAIACVVLIIAAGIILSVGQNKDEKSEQLLRLHIRANSNSDFDQSVKYVVKSAVVDFLSDKVAAASSKEEVVNVINNNIKNIEDVADNVLQKNGVTYKSSASVNNEFFPTRTYDDLVLEEGYYDALIINLGSGKGDNWWCVVYPPLCFVGATKNGTNQIRYKSIFQLLFDNILQ